VHSRFRGRHVRSLSLRSGPVRPGVRVAVAFCKIIRPPFSVQAEVGWVYLRAGFAMETVSMGSLGELEFVFATRDRLWVVQPKLEQRRGEYMIKGNVTIDRSGSGSSTRKSR
jgi:hypothetical protein